jgi:monoamine oxidase
MMGLFGASLLAGCAADGGAKQRRKRARIVVVGAGAAGIAAARDLRDAGHDVTVLEARKRIGGRIDTITLAGAPVELGANWIHGLDGNPLVPLLRATGTATAPVADVWPVLRDASGKLATEAEMDAAWKDVAGRQRVASQRAEKLDEDVALASVLTPPTSQTSAWFMRSGLENEYAQDPTKLSAWWYDEGGIFGDQDRLVTGGYIEFLRRMAHGLSVRFDSEVKAIRTMDDEFRVQPADGEPIAADALVLTVPLPVLQGSLDRWEFPGRDAIAAASKNITMGSLEKVVLRTSSLGGVSGNVVLGATDPSHIGQGIGEFHVISRHASELSTIVALVGGATARTLVQQGERAMINAAVAGLTSALGSAIVSVRAARASRWSADPLARGSYTALDVGATPDDRRRLAQLFGDRVAVAGEATDHREPSTVHGALRSGRRAARQLIEALQ